MATLTATKIANMAIGRIGAKQIATGLTLDTDTTPDGLQAALHYEQTRDALLRSYVWRFATGRANLQQDSVSPAFEWKNQFILPTDCLRIISVYSDEVENPDQITETTYAVEGKKLLTNETTISIRYVKQVTDVTLFDQMFVDVLVIQLALKLLYPLAGTDATQLGQGLREELRQIMSSARLVSFAETNTIGENNAPTWNNSRYSGVQ